MPDVVWHSVQSLETVGEQDLHTLGEQVRDFIWNAEDSGKSTMMDKLRRLNVEITYKEVEGDKAFFDELLAPMFAFRRAYGAFEDRQTFLAGLKRGGAQRECDPNSVEITPLGDMRAFVTCIVQMKINDEWKDFHNARLFVLDPSDWRLLAWANEAIAV
jgi:hypothetical protein